MASETIMRRRIMIIDDDRDVREALGCWLEAAGYEVLIFPDGYSALASIALELDRSPVDLILLDLNMPGMDGMAVLRELRRRQRTIPVIIMSGMYEQQVVRDAVSAGARDFVSKPIDLSRLRKTCERVLRDTDSA